MPRLRWLMIFMCFLANVINFIDRANLAVAAPHIQADFGFDAAVMGLILSGFFWTYAVMQLPMGWLIDRFGARVLLTFSVAWWSVFTMATAVSNGFLSLFGCRLLLGAGEAGALPNFAKVTSLWFPTRERGFASSLWDSGSRVGSAISLPVVAWLISVVGWKASFVATGGIGLVWAVVWYIIYRDPDKHPAITAAILAELQASQGDKDKAEAQKIPWLSLFRYRTIWGMMIGFFCVNFSAYFFITWFPSYLMQARGFSLANLGTLGIIPALIAIPGGWLGGLASDWLFRRGWSLTAARKTCMVVGMLLASSISLSAFVTSNVACLAFFSLAYASISFTGANIWALPAEVAPSRAHVASIAGIQNFASNLAGIILTTFTGIVLVLTRGSFVIPLVTAGVICLIGAASYLFIVGRVEPLPLLEGDRKLAVIRS